MIDVILMETKELIKATITRLLEEHSADEITVKMVCLESGISKQTLYNHYYCVMDAAEDAFRDLFSQFCSGCGDSFSMAEVVRCALQMLSSKRRIAMHLYNSSHRSEFIAMVRNSGSELISDMIDKCASEAGIEISFRDREFMLDFYMYIFMGITENFFRGRMRADPCAIAEKCDAMTRGHMLHSLKNMRDLERGEF